VQGVARVTHGSAAFVQDHEVLEPVCIAMLKKAIAPAISKAIIHWPASASFRSQTKPPPIFADCGFSGFALYPCNALPEQATVKLTGESVFGKVEMVVPVPTSARIAFSSEEAILHKMFARSLILDVEEAERVSQCSTSRSRYSTEAIQLSLHFSYRTEAIQLSLQHSVLCSCTAFVAVEHGSSHSTERSVEIGKNNLGPLLNMKFACLENMDRCIMDELQSQSQMLSCSSKAFLCKCEGRPRRSCARIAVDLVTSWAVNLRSTISTFWMHSLAPLGRIASSSIEANASSPRTNERSEARPGLPECHGPPQMLQKSLTTMSSASPSAEVPKALAPNGRGTISNVEAIERLLRLTRCNGSFTYSSALKALVGLEEEAIATWAHEQWDKPVSNDVLVTAAVLNILATDFNGERLIWELVAKKTTEWLHTQQHEWRCESINSVEVLLAAAGSHLRNGPNKSIC
jgi:hypothetical protein